MIEKDLKNIKTLRNDAYDKRLKSSVIKKFKKESNEVANPTPVTIANVKEPGKNKNKYKNLRVLCDSGGSHSLIDEGYCDVKTKSTNKYQTGGGLMRTEYESEIHFSLPEFSDSKMIHWNFSVADASKIGYDMVIGRDLMTAIGMDMSFEKKVITWDQVEVSMRSFNHAKKMKYSAHEMNIIVQEMQEPASTREATNRVLKKILDAKYEKANLVNVVKKAIHLTGIQQNKLLKLLQKYEDLFDGTLGEWKTDPVSFELKEGAKPHSQRHYPMPHIHKETFKKELKRMVELGILEKVQESEWGSPTFIIPKKNGTVRFVSDFRRLNAKLKRKPYPLPRISDTLQNLDGFTHATALDLNMGYYHIVLSPESADMCTIITEFGKFRYKRLPMGVCGSPDIFQAKINELLGDIEGIRAYIDDVLAICKGSFEDHLAQLEEVFRRCQTHNLKINADKCFFCVEEIEYLGYIITREGIKPNPKKIDAIQKMTRPTTVTEVRRLIGMVQYYRDLWQRRSHILQPFTELSGGKKNAKIEWTPELDKSFQDIKQMVCKDAMLAYPDWTKPFDIHTDASDYQLGAVISQEGRPIAYFSRKLNSAQLNYTTTEKELLSIVECVKEFRNILYGYEIRVFSDHKNLVHAATMSQSQRVMRWRLILKEFGPDIRHISDDKNIVADALSRLPTANNDPIEQRTDAQDQVKMTTESELFILEDDEEFPLHLSLVRRTQQIELTNNSKLRKLLQDNKSGYKINMLEGIELVTMQGKLYVPQTLRKRTLE